MDALKSLISGDNTLVVLVIQICATEIPEVGRIYPAEFRKSLNVLITRHNDWLVSTDGKPSIQTGRASLCR
jgi:hypothetical protein